MYTVGHYLTDRLAEAGVDRVFGVPGDYTLALLDYVVEHPRLQWTGCTNELNAGYATDGYARLRGIGALMTTFGVGELSAINALAGSFAEHVPVVHIVGSPASGSQAAHRVVHHSLGDGVFTHFAAMHGDITCAHATLDADNATSEIDRVLLAVLSEHLPGYLLLPADVTTAEVDPPSEALHLRLEPLDTRVADAFTEAAAELFETAGSVEDVVVLAGLLVQRVRAIPELVQLLAAGPLDHAVTMWGKSVVDESDPHFLGIYAGGVSDEAVRRSVEDAPVLVVAGVQFTDLTSGFFSQHLTRERTIELGTRTASVGEKVFTPLPLGAALRSLTELVDGLKRRSTPRPVVTTPAAAPERPEPSSALTQGALWDLVAESLQPGDIVLADQGCAFYGVATHRMPHDTWFIGQPLWASIGYTLPALVGACLAEPSRRGVLLVGDGAAQMTVQELSTLLRLDVRALVIVVDNDGYTVERAIHGADQAYNDIARWDWTKTTELFGPQRSATARRVTTAGELQEALAAAENARGLSLVQAVVPALDIPKLLAQVAEAAAHANARKT